MRFFVVSVIVIVGLILGSCGEGESDFTVDNLQRWTTYYWRVVADDGKGGVAESDTYSFTTEQ